MPRRSSGDIDETDWMIIGLLLNDGRKSHAEMARSLGLPETTVRDRVARLMREDFVRIVAVINSDRFSSVIEIVVTLAVDPGLVDDVAQAVAERAETRSVRRVIGFCDLIAEAGVDTEASLMAYMDHISKIPGIRNVGYAHALRLYKGQYVIPHGWQDRQVIRSTHHGKKSLGGA